ncbi:MAG: hypothetical protein EA425_03650 [Puniceicoccaceae bacterium]|nr:MAG: hypothetical protein EA425_03650 [Puniceicoccaceae bacterium]
MGLSAKELEESLLALPLEERARLVDRLIGSLEAAPSATWYESWDQEIASRIEARGKGDLQVNEGKAVVDKLWKSLEE